MLLVELRQREVFFGVVARLDRLVFLFGKRLQHGLEIACVCGQFGGQRLAVIGRVVAR